MTPLSALLVFTALRYCHGFELEPELAWPEEYHFRGEEINLISGIVKPIEIWYSSSLNRSRIDLYGGLVSRYYYGLAAEHHYGRIYMIHPEVAEDDASTEISCEMAPHDDDARDFLPDTARFQYSGRRQLDGQEVQVWTKSVSILEEFREEETLLVLPAGSLGDGLYIPARHHTRKWNLGSGALERESVFNYYGYEPNVGAQDLNATKREECADWTMFTQEFTEAVNVLYPGIDSDLDLAFHRFKRHHYRDYVDEEHHQRKHIFKYNWDMVREHNKLKLSYKLALNEFADKLPSELAYLNSMRVSSPARGTHPFPYTQRQLELMERELPDHFDMRMEGFTSPIRNQGHCGSCWAFAMAGTMEGTLAREEGGRLYDLSEQSLVDCAWQYNSHGCGGTEAIESVFEYVLHHGLPTVQEYGPYLEEDGFCKVENMSRVFSIKGYMAVTADSAPAMKAALVHHGPVLAGVFVTTQMQFYKSGVFYDVFCPTDEPDMMNHAVVVVGYGMRDGALYWLVRNSWGQEWGEGGYMLLAAHNNNCNLLNTPYLPVL